MAQVTRSKATALPPDSDPEGDSEEEERDVRIEHEMETLQESDEPAVKQLLFEHQNGIEGSEEDSRISIVGTALQAEVLSVPRQSSSKVYKSAQQSAGILNTVLKDIIVREGASSEPPTLIKASKRKADDSSSPLDSPTKRSRQSCDNVFGNKKTTGLKRVHRKQSKTDEKALDLLNGSRANRDTFDLPNDSPTNPKLKSKTNITEKNPIPVRRFERGGAIEQVHIPASENENSVMRKDPLERRPVGRPKGTKNVHKIASGSSPSVGGKPGLRSSKTKPIIPERSTQEPMPLDHALTQIEDNVNHEELQRLSESQLMDARLRKQVKVIVEEPRTSIFRDVSNQAIPSPSGVEKSVSHDEDRSKDHDLIELEDGVVKAKASHDEFSNSKKNDEDTKHIKDAEGDEGVEGDESVEDIHKDVAISSPSRETGTADAPSSQVGSFVDITSSPESQDDGNVANTEDGEMKGAEEDEESHSGDSEDTKITENSDATIELFGEQKAWKEITAAAKKIGVSVSKGRRIRHELRLETTTIEEFVKHTTKAQDFYKGLLGDDTTEGDAEYKNKVKHLNRIIRWLEMQVDKLDENADGTQKSAMVQDIHVYAIPRLIFLLNQAMIVRSPLYSTSDDTRHHEEIIRLINISIALCEKAKAWEAEPTTSGVPFKGAIRRTILPRLRTIRDAFENEVSKKLEIKRKLERQQAKAREGEKDLERSRREEEEKEREIRETSRRTHEDLQRNGIFISPRRPQDNQKIVVTSPRHQPPIGIPWTREQSRELIRQLKKSFYLPVEERYIHVLNTPLLQNKLPEHIHEQTMSLKPSMEMKYLGEKRRIPHWVSSLE